MKNKILIFIAGLLLGLSVIFMDIKEDKISFNLVYTKDASAIVARLGVEERKAWRYEENLIEDDKGWIWESNLNLESNEIIYITVEGDRVIDYRVYS